jgi:hypothetical protein
MTGEQASQRWPALQRIEAQSVLSDLHQTSEDFQEGSEGDILLRLVAAAGREIHASGPADEGHLLRQPGLADAWLA